jgi:hypothetical protein
MRRTLTVFLFAALWTVGCSKSKTPGNPPTPSPCGNGMLDSGEQCDGSLLAGESCFSAGYDGGVLACTADCTYDFAACTGDPPVCGDATAEGFEECDGADLRGHDCRALGYDGGTLACAAACVFDAAGCTGDPPVCGDGNAEGLEECDGLDLRGYACTDFGYSGGTLICAACAWDFSACAGTATVICGDGRAEGDEQCDGADLRNRDCVDLGFDGGLLACSDRCGYDTGACVGAGAVCGDGVVAGLEECDGAELRGATCTDLGYVGGDLACDSSCTLDPSACTAPACPNGVLEPGESCDSAELSGEDCLSLGYTGGTLACTATCTFDTTACTTPSCGNGTAEGSEQCDGNDLRQRDCTDLGLGTGSLTCNADCTFDTSACSVPTCGDGTVNQAAEECDGDDLNEESCRSLGFQQGQLGCNSNCTFNTLLCFGSTATCGDDNAEGPEPCDGTDLRGETCESRGYDAGALACVDCQFDEEGCTGDGPTCGDGVAEGDEQCDGADLRGATCTDFGFNGGTLGCTSCYYDVSGCTFIVGPECGNDQAEGVEVCDGTDLRQQSCTTLGLGAGELACSGDCRSYDVSDCSNAPTCGNNQAEGVEVCDGTDLRGFTLCSQLGYGSGAVACLPTCKAYDLSACTNPPGWCGNAMVHPPAEQCDGANLYGASCESLGYSSGDLDCNANCSYDVADCSL